MRLPLLIADEMGLEERGPDMSGSDSGTGRLLKQEAVSDAVISKLLKDFTRSVHNHM